MGLPFMRMNKPAQVLAVAVNAVALVGLAGCATHSGLPAHTRARPAPVSMPATDWSALVPLRCPGTQAAVRSATPLAMPGAKEQATVVVAQCETPGVPPSSAFLFEGGPAARPRLVSTLLTDADDAVAVTVSPSATGALLKARTWSPNVPRCCPDRWAEWDYDWNGTALRLRAHSTGALHGKPA